MSVCDNEEILCPFIGQPDDFPDDKLNDTQTLIDVCEGNGQWEGIEWAHSCRADDHLDTVNRHACMYDGAGDSKVLKCSPLDLGQIYDDNDSICDNKDIPCLLKDQPSLSNTFTLEDISNPQLLIDVCEGTGVFSGKKKNPGAFCRYDAHLDMDARNVCMYTGSGDSRKLECLGFNWSGYGGGPGYMMSSDGDDGNPTVNTRCDICNDIDEDDPPEYCKTEDGNPPGFIERAGIFFKRLIGHSYTFRGHIIDCNNIIYAEQRPSILKYTWDDTDGLNEWNAEMFLTSEMKEKLTTIGWNKDTWNATVVIYGDRNNYSHLIHILPNIAIILLLFMLLFIFLSMKFLKNKNLGKYVAFSIGLIIYLTVHFFVGSRDVGPYDTDWDDLDNDKRELAIDLGFNKEWWGGNITAGFYLGNTNYNLNKDDTCLPEESDINCEYRGGKCLLKYTGEDETTREEINKFNESIRLTGQASSMRQNTCVDIKSIDNTLTDISDEDRCIKRRCAPYECCNLESPSFTSHLFFTLILILSLTNYLFSGEDPASNLKILFCIIYLIAFNIIHWWTKGKHNWFIWLSIITPLILTVLKNLKYLMFTKEARVASRNSAWVDYLAEGAKARPNTPAGQEAPEMSNTRAMAVDPHKLGDLVLAQKQDAWM